MTSPSVQKARVAAPGATGTAPRGPGAAATTGRAGLGGTGAEAGAGTGTGMGAAGAAGAVAGAAGTGLAMLLPREGGMEAQCDKEAPYDEYGHVERQLSRPFASGHT